MNLYKVWGRSMYKCKHFKIAELVHPDLLNQHGEVRCWMFFDERMLRFIDWARDQYGPIIINGSGLMDCGARKMDSATGAGMSAHKLWRAFDLHILSIEKSCGANRVLKSAKYADIRADILNRPEWAFINMEKSVGKNPIWWLHVDSYNRDAREFAA